MSERLPNCPFCGEHALDDGEPGTWCTNEECPIFDVRFEFVQWRRMVILFAAFPTNGTPNNRGAGV